MRRLKIANNRDDSVCDITGDLIVDGGNEWSLDLGYGFVMHRLVFISYYNTVLTLSKIVAEC